METLQRIYIFMLNPIGRVTSKLSVERKNLILSICFFLISLQCFFYTTWEKYGVSFGYAELLIINTVFFCIIIIFSIDKPLIMIEWNKDIYIPWFLCSVFMIAAGLHHSITNALLFFAGLMLLVFPCFYFVWNNRTDYDLLYRIVSKAVIAAILFFYFINILSVPYVAGQAYQGIAVNPNSIGIASIAGVIASLYLVCVENKNLWLYVVSAGISSAFAYFSVSRASIIAILLAYIVFAIVYIRGSETIKLRINKKMIIMCATIISILLSVVCVKFILTEITPKTQPYIEHFLFESSYAENGSEEINEANDNLLMEKFSRGEDVASMSSGRTDIWRAYIKELDFIGHERNEQGLYIPEMYGEYSAHNSYIEIAYRCGILAGLLYAWIAIYAAIYSFRFLIGKKLYNYRYGIIPMAVMAFGVLSNLERALYPFEKVHILLFFIALAPMFVKQVKTSRKNEENDNEKLA